MLAREAPPHRWWDALIVAGAAGVFLWLGWLAKIPPLDLQGGWIASLVVAMFVFVLAGGWLLWKRTRFS